MIDIPKTLPDCRLPEMIVEGHKLAKEFAEPGTVKHFALRMGFMPHNNEEAEAILKRIIEERDWLENELERVRLFGVDK